MKPIAHIHTDLPEKFGLPRQSNLALSLKGTIVFEPEFRDSNAVKGLEEYDYIWLLWKFEIPKQEHFQATVRPPRLGGNTRVGVFATRSPFRPNPIGLSSVKLESVELTDQGPVLYVSGVDMMDGTAIYDIKPYIPYADSHPEARGSFAAKHQHDKIRVTFQQELLDKIPAEKRSALLEILEQDPRPSYQDDPDRVYGLSYASFNIQFQVSDQGLTVVSVTPK